MPIATEETYQKTKYDLEDLIVLQHPHKVIRADSIDKSDLEIDLEKGTWTIRDFQGKAFTTQIGKERYMQQGFQWGIIGVYDRTNTEHLHFMVHHSVEANIPIGSDLEY